MENTNWSKQSLDKPLFPDLIWSRPENKRHAGKLLIIGGNLHGFAAPVAAYNASLAAGIGTSRVILPDVLQKALGTSFEQAVFAPSTINGALARKSLDLLLEEAEWADGVLLAGDFGRNSETAILLASFLERFEGQVTLAGDSLDYFLSTNSPLLNRPQTLSVINMGKLQKLAKGNGAASAITHSMSIHELVSFLNQWLTSGKGIITKHQEHFIAAADGKASTTAAKKDEKWQIELAAYASVWWLQQPKSTFNALTTSVYGFMQS